MTIVHLGSVSLQIEGEAGIRSRTVGQVARAAPQRRPMRGAKSTPVVSRVLGGAQPAQSTLARLYQPHKMRDLSVNRRSSTSKAHHGDSK